jgi:hypothetical protein
MFSFQSPYGQRDTTTTFAQVLNAMFTTDEGRRLIQSVQPHEKLPILSGLYIRVHDWDQMKLIAGNRAQRFWTAHILFQKNGNGTYGEINMDRPKGKVHQGYQHFAALNITLPKWLLRHASFKIRKWDML